MAGGKNKKKNSWWQGDVAWGHIGLSDKAVFVKNLAVMIRAGLSINEALEVVRRATMNGRLRLIIAQLNAAVKAGSSLAEALGRQPRVFSAFLIGSVYAGEASGTLSANLDKAATQLNKERELATKVKGALLYPLVVLAAAVGLGILIAFYVLPKIIPMFRGLRGQLPWATRTLIWLAQFLKNYGGWVLLLAIAVGVLISWLATAKMSQRLVHGLILRLPLAGAVSRELNLARFLGTVANMLDSGLNIVEALKISGQALPNWHYRQAALQVSRVVDKGASLAETLGRWPAFFPEMTQRVAAVGEQSGKLSETLNYLSLYYEDEADNITKNLATMVEVILLLLIGGAVLFLALAIILPISNLTSSLGR